MCFILSTSVDLDLLCFQVIFIVSVSVLLGFNKVVSYHIVL